jgi:hypothetical protein
MPSLASGFTPICPAQHPAGQCQSAPGGLVRHKTVGNGFWTAAGSSEGRAPEKGRAIPADNDYVYEDLLRKARLVLIPLRKVNSSRPLEPALTYRMAKARKSVETTGSLIERLLPKHIHSVTARGFELKLACFVVACALGFIAQARLGGNSG